MGNHKFFKNPGIAISRKLKKLDSDFALIWTYRCLHWTWSKKNAFTLERLQRKLIYFALGLHKFEYETSATFVQRRSRVGAFLIRTYSRPWSLLWCDRMHRQHSWASHIARDVAH